MKYVGKLFGQIGRTRGYFDTGKTSEDWDALEARAERAEASLHALRLVCGTTDADKFSTWVDRANARAERAEASLHAATEECTDVRLKWHAVMGACAAKEDSIMEADEELVCLRARAERAEAEVERLNGCCEELHTIIDNHGYPSGIDYRRMESRAERAEAEIIRLRTENSDLKATDTRPLLTGSLTHAGLCRIDGELVDGVFIAVAREQIKACRRLPMYHQIELRVAAMQEAAK